MERRSYHPLSRALMGGKIPVNTLVLEVADREFYRGVIIMDPALKRTLAQGDIYRYPVRGGTKENLELGFKEMNLGRFVARIKNFDDEPLHVQGIKAKGVTRAVAFRPPEGKYVRVYFGNKKAGRPVYDLARLHPNLSLEDMNEASLSGVSRNSVFMPPETPGPPRDYSWVIWAVIGMATVILVILIAANAKKLRE